MAAGVLTLNGTFIVETVGFLLMLLFLARVPLPFLGIPKPVFPWIIDIAEARQRDITAKLQEAEKARAEAEARLNEADEKLVEARRTAETVIQGANRSGEQLRQELREKAEAEDQRLVEGAARDIEAAPLSRPRRTCSTRKAPTSPGSSSSQIGSARRGQSKKSLSGSPTRPPAASGPR